MILQNHKQYLHPECIALLLRYLAGGCFATYGPWVPVRCARIPIWEDKHKKPDLVNAILQDRVAGFFRDASWEDGKLKDLRRALHTWLQEGLPPKNGKSMWIPSTKKSVRKWSFKRFMIASAGRSWIA